MPTAVYWEWLTSAGKEKYRNTAGRPTAAPGQPSERNPFTGEPILTLSQGKYPEMHQTKSRVQIGNVVYNVASDRVERFVQPDKTEWAISPEVAARFLSVDPLTKSYPELTPYQFASNTPISAIDLDGLEAVKPAPPASRPVITLPNVFEILEKLSSGPQSEVITRPSYSPKPYGIPRVENLSKKQKNQYNDLLFKKSKNTASDQEIRDLLDLEDLIKLQTERNREFWKSPEGRQRIEDGREGEILVGELLNNVYSDDQFVVLERVNMRFEDGTDVIPDFTVISRATLKVVSIVDAKTGQAGLTDQQKRLFDGESATLVGARSGIYKGTKVNKETPKEIRRVDLPGGSISTEQY